MVEAGYVAVVPEMDGGDGGTLGVSATLDAGCELGVGDVLVSLEDWPVESV